MKKINFFLTVNFSCIIDSQDPTNICSWMKIIKTLQNHLRRLSIYLGKLYKILFEWNQSFKQELTDMAWIIHMKTFQFVSILGGSYLKSNYIYFYQTFEIFLIILKMIYVIYVILMRKRNILQLSHNIFSQISYYSYLID